MEKGGVAPCRNTRSIRSSGELVTSVLAVLFRCSRAGLHKMRCFHRPSNTKGEELLFGKID